MATPSPMNDPRFRSGPLSTRPALPVGDGMDSRRRLEMLGRRAWTQGDARTIAATAQTLFNADTFGSRFGPRMSSRGAMPPPMLGRPPAQQPMQPPMLPPQGLMPEPQPAAPPLLPNDGMTAPAAAPEMMAPTFAPPPLMPPRLANGGLDISRPLPPSTLDGSAGVPAGPRFSMQAVGDMNAVVDNATGKFVNSYMRPGPPPEMSMLPVPGTDLRVPALGGKPLEGLPVFQESTVPGSLVRRSTEGRPAPTQLTPMDAGKAPRIQSVFEGDVKTNVQWNDQKKRWERVKIYDPGDPDDNGIPGDQRGKAAPAAGAATMTPVKIASGNSFRPVPVQ